MKHRRIWAWMVLGIYLLGVLSAVFSVINKNNELAITALVLIGLGALGTYFLKKDAQQEYEQEKMPKVKKDSPWDPFVPDEKAENDLEEKKDSDEQK